MIRLYRSAIIIIFLSIPIIYYYYQVWLHAVNIPYSDDFDVALVFLNDFIESDLSDKLKLLYSQHAEHRIVFAKVIILITYFIFGKVNFSLLVLIGNFGLLLLGFLFYKLLPKGRNKLVCFLPVVLFLFNLQHWNTAGFALNSMQHFYVLLFAFTSLYLLDKQGSVNLIIAIIMAVSATYTSGNGLFVFPAGIVLLLLQKRYDLDLIVWLSTSIIVISLYFYGYSSHYEGNLIDNLLRHPDNVFSAFIGGLGGFINFERHFDPVSLKSFGFLSAMLMGCTLNIFLLYLIFIKYYRINPFFVCCLLFLILTYASISVARTLSYSVEYISSVPRYKINSIALLVFCYLILIGLFKNKHKNLILITFLLLSSMYNFRSNQVHTDSLRNSTLKKIKGSWFWNRYNSEEELFYEDKVHASSALIKSEKNGIYNMADYTDYYLKHSELVELNLIEVTNNIQFSFEINNKPDNDYITIFDGWAFIKNESSRGNRIYLILKDESKTYIFNMLNSYRQDVTAYFMKQSGEFINLSQSGFTCIIPKEQLKPTIYRVGLLIIRRDNSQGLQYTDKMIDLTLPE